MLRHRLVPTLLALVLLLSISLMADAASPVKPVSVTKGSLSTTVDPRIELLSIVQYLSDYKDKYPHLVSRQDSSYRKDVDDWFAKFKSHPVVGLFDKMFPEGFSYDAPPHAVLYLDADFSLDQVIFKDGAMDIERAGGKERLIEFANALKSFAVESNFSEFFNAHTAFYEKIIKATLDSIQHKDTVEVLEQYYGEKRSSFSIVISPLLGQGSFGPQIEREKGRRETYCIMGPCGEKDGVPVFGSTQFFNQLQRHEFGHSFVNPLTEKHSDICEKYSNLFTPMKQIMESSAYGEWQTVVNESIIRAVTTRLAYRLDGKEAGDRELQSHKRNGFVFTDALIKKLEEYEQNRDKYPTLDSFYPELLKALDGFSESSIAEMLKSGDLIINPIALTAQCLVYDLPDDEAHADALDYVKKIHDTFFGKAEMLDVAKLNDAALREKGDFVLYTTIGSKVFNAATQPLNIKIEGGILTWNGVSAPVSELRIILVGMNPCGPGKCVIYAAGSNKLLSGINHCFHGSCSYHIFQGDKLLREGYYNESFILSDRQK